MATKKRGEGYGHGPMRIQKFLSKAGVCSRRAAEEMMERGEVSVNGSVVRELGTKVEPGKDRVEVGGSVVSIPPSLIYVLMNKPIEVITSMEDPQGRPVITELLPKRMPRIWPVGRLDWDSEGVILFTNDGELTNLMTHPSHSVTKEYALKVQGIIEPESPKLEQLRAGVDIGDPEPTQPVRVRVTGSTGRNTWLQIEIAEGRNRQLRRMLEVIGHPVMRLRRLRIGPLTIDGLSSGSYRSLHSGEVQALYDALGQSVPRRARPTERQKQREKREARGSATERRRRATKREYVPGRHWSPKPKPASADEAEAQPSARPKPSESRASGRAGARSDARKAGGRRGAGRHEQRGRGARDTRQSGPKGRGRGGPKGGRRK